MQRKVKRSIVIGAAGLIAAGAGGAAIAATSSDSGKKAEQAIIDDAAGKLNVSPGDLRSALKGAVQDQIDQAVKDGRLTQKQADAIKKRMDESGRVLPFGGPGGPGGRGAPGGPGPRGFGHRGGPFGHGGPMALFGAAAKALGISTAQLRAELRDGKSIADVAKAKGKSTDDVRSAMHDAVKQQLDDAVKDKDLTQAQADQRLEELDSHLDDLIAGKRPAAPGRPHGPGPGPGFFGGGHPS